MTTDDRRKELAAKGPIILYGNPSLAEIAEARGRAGGRGILVVPDEMRGSLIPDALLPDDLRTTTEKEADENAKAHRLREEAVSAIAKGMDVPEEVITGEIPEWREKETLYESREQELDDLWHQGKISGEKHKILREHLREEFSYDREPEESEMATMAEEPIEDRLRRQWLNGYMMGFREGFERSGWLDR